MKILRILIVFTLAFEQLLFPVAGLFAQDAPADKDFAQDL